MFKSAACAVARAQSAVKKIAVFLDAVRIKAEKFDIKIFITFLSK